MAKVVLTGAGGFLGTAMTRAFVEAGHRVRATDLPRADLSVHSELGAETMPADVTVPADAAAAVQGMDIVVHAAGIFDLTAPDSLLWKVNADAVTTVCEAAADATRVVHISSTGVYGRCGLDTDETAPTAAAMSYERSKLDGEKNAFQTCERLGVPLAVLRPTLIYGEGSRYGLAPTMALFALRKKKGLMTLPIAGGGPVGHLVHVRDVAAAAVLLATHPDAPGQAYNVADDLPVHAGDLVRALAETSKVPINSMALPWWTTHAYPPFKRLVAKIVADQNTRMARSWANMVREEGLEDALLPRLDMDFIDYVLGNHSYDTQRLRNLGFQCAHPDPFAGIALTADWYRDQRWLPAFQT